jgi:hypothetical protein
MIALCVNGIDKILEKLLKRLRRPSSGLSRTSNFTTVTSSGLTSSGRGDREVGSVPGIRVFALLVPDWLGAFLRDINSK